MSKKTFFFVDDVIWCLRDLARNHPHSMFDVPYFKMLKTAHDKYGLKIQLNLFYRTDFFYGSDEFTLADVPADYKKEWEDNSDWLKLAFHAKQEFPDYPYINAEYNDVKNDFLDIQREVYRFASPKNFAYSLIPHWLPVSKDACRALADCGVKYVSPSSGEREEYNGDPASLPYGHAMRLLQNRKPETKIFIRHGLNTAIARSLSGYNHISQEQQDETGWNLKYIQDRETGIRFKKLGHGYALNLRKVDTLADELQENMDKEFIGIGNHEQYFYSDYLAYQPDYAEKLYVACDTVVKNGYEFIFADDID